MTDSRSGATGPDFIDNTTSDAAPGSFERGDDARSVSPTPQPPSFSSQFPTAQPSVPDAAPSPLPVEHPRGMTVLILGIASFLLWIPGFFGWAIGSQAKKEIQRGDTNYVWDGALRAGHMLSIIGTLLVGALIVCSTLLALLIWSVV